MLSPVPAYEAHLSPDASESVTSLNIAEHLDAAKLVIQTVPLSVGTRLQMCSGYERSTSRATDPFRDPTSAAMSPSYQGTRRLRRRVEESMEGVLRSTVIDEDRTRLCTTLERRLACRQRSVSAKTQPHIISKALPPFFLLRTSSILRAALLHNAHATIPDARPLPE